jgi:hypothetical protein
VPKVDGEMTVRNPIETAQQFFDWFANIEKEMEQEQEEVYRLRHFLLLVICLPDELL